MREEFAAIVLGAGAAGLYAAAHAGRGGPVLVIDHSAAPGEKIRISGGGRCNFTNLHTTPERFLSANPHFAKSALRRHTAQDFVALVRRHGIAFHEKTLGQLFCDGSAREIVAMLVAEARAAGAEVRLQTAVAEIGHADGRFRLRFSDGSRAAAPALVVATGGRSIPKMGATGFAYDVARRFGLGVTETRPALVPLTFSGAQQQAFSALAGVSLAGRARVGRVAFDEGVLFTHRGLSGPAILQISSHWREGEPLVLSLVPGIDVPAALRARRAEGGAATVAAALGTMLPRRLAAHLAREAGAEGPLAAASDSRLAALGGLVNGWTLRPAGSEGWRTAEVTLGGVDTAGLNAATMEAKALPGLYFVGEAVDVTGWLGGYNFQWAWSSGWAAGTAIAARGDAG